MHGGPFRRRQIFKMCLDRAVFAPKRPARFLNEGAERAATRGKKRWLVVFVDATGAFRA